MISLNLLSEETIRRTIETSDSNDAEKSLKWLLMMQRMNDARTPNGRNHYTVKLYDYPLPEGTTFKLTNAEIAKEVLTNLAKDIEISNGGFESENSTYLGFYAD